MLMPLGHVLYFDYIEWLPKQPLKWPALPTLLPIKQSLTRTGGELRFNTLK